jgi:hypothetical protein
MTALFGCHFDQPCLPGFAALVYPHPRRSSLGLIGEVTVQRQLEAAHYWVRPGRPGQGDLHAIVRSTGQVIRVEVKTAMQSVDHKWRFTLWKDRHTDFRFSDVVILLAALADFSFVPFAVPVADLGQRSQLCITSHPATYKGWLSPYRLSSTADLLTPLVMHGEGPGERWAEVLERPLSEAKGA